MSEKQVDSVPLTSKQEDAGEPSPVHAQQPVVYPQQPIVHAQQPIVHAQQPVVYAQQPVVYVTQQAIAPPPGSVLRPPKDYFVMSIMTLLFCFWPLGIAALLKSIEARDAVARGDYTAAQAASKTALQLNRWAILIGKILYVLLFIIVSMLIILIIVYVCI